MRFTPHEVDVDSGLPIMQREFDRFRDFVVRQSCKCILVREEGDDDDKRPHCHLLIWYDKTQSTFRQLFHKYFNKLWGSKTNVYVGNSCFSIKDEDQSDKGDKPFWYICKGFGLGQLPNVLYKMDYTENDIKTYHEAGWAYVNELKQKTVNVTHKKVVKDKKESDTFVIRVAKDLKERYVKSEYHRWDFGLKMDREKVFDAVCDNLGEMGKTIDEIIIYRLMGGVMMVLDRPSAKHLYKKSVMDKFRCDE